MGTLGEVGIAQDEDYAKWGMEIKVSFRDGENVQLLTGQRQSGGVSYYLHKLLFSLNANINICLL